MNRKYVHSETIFHESENITKLKKFIFSSHILQNFDFQMDFIENPPLYHWLFAINIKIKKFLYDFYEQNWKRLNPKYSNGWSMSTIFPQHPMR